MHKLPTKAEASRSALLSSFSALSGNKKKPRACIKELDAEVGAEVVIVEVKTGQARFELNIRASHAQVELIPSLQNDGSRCLRCVGSARQLLHEPARPAWLQWQGSCRCAASGKEGRHHICNYILASGTTCPNAASKPGCCRWVNFAGPIIGGRAPAASTFDRSSSILTVTWIFMPLVRAREFGEKRVRPQLGPMVARRGFCGCWCWCSSTPAASSTGRWCRRSFWGRRERRARVLRGWRGAHIQD